MNFNLLQVDEAVTQKIREFSLPDEMLFGRILAPIMVVMDYKNEQWGAMEMIPYGPLSLDPSTKVFHYAQEIFEGMKAFKQTDGNVVMFRPEQNWERFNFSARRMAMPEIPKEQFMQATQAMSAYCANIIPQKPNHSLYIRPFMIATEASLGIGCSTEYKFVVIASPSGPYFKGEAVDVYIEREKVRAVPGGTGNAKVGGNYGGGLYSSIETKAKGYHQTLWLDARERRYVEEMSGMNFFAIINGEVHTPELTETILAGITRDSLLNLAQEMGLKTVEGKLDIDELMAKVESGECSEAFVCGTAAIITPIASFGEKDGRTYKFKNTPDIGPKLKSALQGIQEGKRSVSGTNLEDWIVPVPKIDI